MRYLKVTAQDRSGNGKADVVHLHFHDAAANRVHEAIALDISADGQIDFGFAGDLNGDGEQDFTDQLLLQSFTEAFLQLNWFNTGDNWERALSIHALDYHQDGTANSVTLKFSEDDGSPGAPILIRTAAAYDGDNDGNFDSFTNSDVNNDGVANKADKELLRTLVNTFVPLHW